MQPDTTILNVDPRKQNFLVGRTEKIIATDKKGKREILAKSKKDGGFFCEVCKELYKCDIAFFTHLNSASHNKKLGMSLKVEAVSGDAVRDKLEAMAKAKQMRVPDKHMKKT